MTFSRARLLLFALLTEGVVCALALLLAAWLQIDLDITPRHAGRELIIALLATTPLVVLFLAAMSDLGDRVGVLTNLKRLMRHDIRRVFMQAKFVDLFVISLTAGVAEEMLFRGVLQSQLGLLPASILFGLVHFVTPAYAIVATIMGFYLGLVFSIFDSLFAVVLVHTLYDLVALAYIRYVQP